MNVFVVIPFFSNGIELNQNDVAVFLTREQAKEYIQSEGFMYYEIVETILNLK